MLRVSKHNQKRQLFQTGLFATLLQNAKGTGLAYSFEIAKRYCIVLTEIKPARLVATVVVVRTMVGMVVVRVVLGVSDVKESIQTQSHSFTLIIGLVANETVAIQYDKVVYYTEMYSITYRTIRYDNRA